MPKPTGNTKPLDGNCWVWGNSNDNACINCYKSHLVILNANKLVSKDSDLLLVISTLKQNAKAINELHVGNLQHVLDAAVNHTTIMEAAWKNAA